MVYDNNIKVLKEISYFNNENVLNILFDRVFTFFKNENSSYKEYDLLNILVNIYNNKNEEINKILESNLRFKKYYKFRTTLDKATLDYFKSDYFKRKKDKSEFNYMFIK